MKKVSGHKSKKEKKRGKRYNRSVRVSRKMRTSAKKRDCNWAVTARLYPTKEQASVIRQTAGARRFVWNQLVEYSNAYKKENQLYPEDKLLTSFFNSLKVKYEWLKTIHSKMLQQILIDFKRAVKDFIKGKRGEPTFKKKKEYRDSFRLPVDAFRYVKGNRISFTKKIDEMHFKCSRKDERLLNRYQKCIKSSTFTCHPSGKISVSLLMGLHFYPKNLQKRREEFLAAGNELKPAGCDMGLLDIIITSDGKKYKKIDVKKKNKRYDKLKRKHSRKLERSKKEWKKLPEDIRGEYYKNSKRAEKTRKRAAALAENITNYRKDKHHEIANDLVVSHNLLVFESLNISGMMKNHKLARAFADQGLYSLLEKVKIKSSWLHVMIEQIGRWVASSKICSETGCGFKMPSMPLDVREWVCPQCGKIHDRDINAAINILNEGLRMLEENKQSGAGCDGTRPSSSGLVKCVDGPTMDDRRNDSTSVESSDLKSSGQVKRKKNVELKIQTAGCKAS